jgi:glycosyltransferase 2 family protein
LTRPRERLRRPSRTTLVAVARGLGWLLAIGLIAALALRLAALWNDARIDPGQADLSVLALAFAASALSLATPGFVWVRILRGLGVGAPWSWANLYFRAQLGKYLPGGVWQYAGRAALARVRGVPLWPASLSLLIELAAGTAAAAAVGVAALYPETAAPLAATAVAVALVWTRKRETSVAVARRVERSIFRRQGPSESDLAATAAITFRAWLSFVPLWILHGIGFWLLARALFSVSVDQLPFFVGSFAIAWLAGLAAVFAPGGIGVREAVVAALLTPRIGAAEALTLALASRTMLLTIDVLLGGAALLVPVRRPLTGGGAARKSIA